MPNYTENLNLFKYDTTTDGDLPFNLQNALNSNWDILDEAVNDKLDTDDLVDVKVVVATYGTASTGYRLWSDGWCEQWGNASGVEASTGFEVTLLQPFANANGYIVNLVRLAKITTTAEAGYVYTRGLTSTTFEIYSTVATTYKWYACGYTI